MAHVISKTEELRDKNQIYSLILGVFVNFTLGKFHFKFPINQHARTNFHTHIFYDFFSRYNRCKTKTSFKSSHPLRIRSAYDSPVNIHHVNQLIGIPIRPTLYKEKKGL